jgi:hypothetical protein
MLQSYAPARKAFSFFTEAKKLQPRRRRRRQTLVNMSHSIRQTFSRLMKPVALEV